MVDEAVAALTAAQNVMLVGQPVAELQGAAIQSVGPVSVEEPMQKANVQPQPALISLWYYSEPTI